MNNGVLALAVSGSDLYAGGDFATADGSAASFIAKWSGSTWSPLGSGMNNGVYALAVSGSDLYVGGAFTMAGGSAANLVAKWDGSSWSPLGSGVDSSVVALAVSGSGLYVGGYFTTAGGKVSAFIAQANLSGFVPLSMVQNIRINGGSVTLDCLGVVTSAYALQRASDVRFTESLTTVLTTNAPAGGQFQCIDPDPPSTTAFYRLLKQ